MAHLKVLRNHLEDPDFGGMIVFLKRIFKKWNGGMKWINVGQDKEGWRAVVSGLCTRQDFNLLKPNDYVMHQQFNIQQLYALPTLYLYVLYLSENKQRLVPLTA